MGNIEHEMRKVPGEIAEAVARRFAPKTRLSADGESVEADGLNEAEYEMIAAFTQKAAAEAHAKAMRNALRTTLGNVRSKNLTVKFK